MKYPKSIGVLILCIVVFSLPATLAGVLSSEGHYKYDSGREGDWFLTGFSPRKQNLTLYIMPGIERFEKLMKKLGKYKTGKGCL